ncbi:MAG: N-acetylmuramoyl-L-alanine amidase [Acidobacteriia bacterium]|nr:N-acetylmuramoyl-L-alanine amidase [Terriglobia bacterium]
MKRLAALAVAVPLLYAQTDPSPALSVTAVRYWQIGDATRVVVEVSGSFLTRSDRLHNPERVYYDILNARPLINSKRGFSEMVNGPMLKRIRVAETTSGITRVVLDLGDGVEATPSELVNPNRLIIELRKGTASPAVSEAPPSKPPVVAEAPPPKLPERPRQLPPRAEIPAVATPPSVEAPNLEPPPADVVPVEAARVQSAKVEPAKVEFARVETPKAEAAPVATPAPAPAPVRSILNETPKSARPTSDGDNSLVRALGLKINRVVIDPGHGGHDEGTVGPHGLMEKDLVLDVAQRLGKLIEKRMSAEVIFTRSDDTFIPLEGRTELANEKKADLFLSIHANSSPASGVTGIETYYLNFTQSTDALDVAARENASSQKTVFELQDLIQKITLHDKAEESREFANRIQASLQALSVRNFPGEKNRGVRKAPFVVLIGANMPSVLAEIGFLSNRREEALLKRSDYRQKLAEALYRGVSGYAGGLSHFQVAKN